MSDTFSLFVKDFTHLDGAMLDPVYGMTGISYTLGIKFIGETNKEGIVFDFSKAKKCAKKVVDDNADHALIVAKNDVIINMEDDIAQVKTDSMEYVCPVDALFIVDQVTEPQLFSKLEQLIYNACIQDPACSKLKQVELTYTVEEPSDKMPFFYHYTHGLKDSCNKCERPGHGHRSTVEVYIDGVRNNAVEKEVCGFYHNKHLVFKDNIVHEDGKFTTIEYTTAAGNKYSLKILRESVIIYPIETTVENISKITAQWIKATFNFSDVTVVAYEGIEKGCSYLLKDNYRKKLGSHNPTEFLKG